MPQGVRNALRSDAFAKNLDSFDVCRPSGERGRFPDEKQQGGLALQSRRDDRTQPGVKPPVMMRRQMKSRGDGRGLNKLL